MPLLSGLWLKVIAIGAVVLAVLAAIARIFYAGKTAARNEQIKEQLDHANLRTRTEDHIAVADPDERERLRGKWTR